MLHVRKTLGEAVTREFNTEGARHHCPPLLWLVTTAGQLTGSTYSDTDAADVPAALEKWADLLSLAPVEHPECAGTLEYQRTIDGWSVEVWGITDRAAFDHYVSEDAP